MMCMSVRVVALAFFAMLLESTGAQAASVPRTLAASGPWNLDYADDSCRLVRSFGPPDERITLRFERFQPGDRFSLTIIGAPVRTSTGLSTPLKLAFGKGTAPVPAVAVTGTVGEAKTPMLLLSSLMLVTPPASDDLLPFTIQLEDERKITQLTLDQRGDKHDYVLALGPMDEPMAGLRTCMDELLTHWGIDAAAQRTLSRQAKPASNPGTWLRSGDYPADALNEGNSAIVNFRLTVDPQGKPAGCAVQGGTLGPKFREITCSLLLKRARFQPALDAQAKPVASYYINSVKWIIG